MPPHSHLGSFHKQAVGGPKEEGSKGTVKGKAAGRGVAVAEGEEPIPGVIRSGGGIGGLE